MVIGMDSVVSCLGLVRQIAALVQTAGAVNERCGTLGNRVRALEPLLIEVQEQAKAEHAFTENDRKGFIQLKEALGRAKTVLLDVGRIKGNKLKLFFKASSMNDDLAKVSAEIQECLQFVALTNLGISISTREIVKDTRTILTELAKESKRKSVEATEQRKGLEEKVLEARRHEQGWAGSSRSAHSALEVLANYFDVGIESVKTDLQGLNDVSELKMQTTQVDPQSQQAIIDELFQQLLMALGELEKKSCPTCNPKDVMQCPLCQRAAISIRHSKDLLCTICHDVFKDPVILPTGFTFCRVCIKRWWEKNGAQECPTTRVLIDPQEPFIPNRSIEQLLLSVPETGHGTPRAATTFAEAAEEFQSGHKFAGSKDLQYHCQSLQGRRDILAAEGLVDALLEFAESTTCSLTVEPTLQILEALTEAADHSGCSLSVEELNTVWPHFLKADRLQTLVALMAGASGGMDDPGLLAARVVFNVIHGSERCLYIARTSLAGLVTAFFRLAVAGHSGSGSVIGSKYIGWKGLSRLAEVAYSADDSSMVSNEMLIGTLANLVSRGIAFEESVVALASLLGSYGKGVHHLVQVSFLISRFASCKEAGKDAVVKLLRRISDETTRKGGDADVEVWGKPLMRSKMEAENFVRSLLELISSAATGKVEQSEGLDDAILLLRFLFTHGVCVWALKPDEGSAASLLNGLMGKRVSSQARMVILDIMLHITENTVTQNEWHSEWQTQLVKADGVAALCSIVQSNQEPLCRMHSAIVLERLVPTGNDHGTGGSASTHKPDEPTAADDDIKQRLIKGLSLEKLVKLVELFKVQENRADEGRISAAEGRVAAAGLMSMIFSGKETEHLKIRCMDHLVYVLSSVEHREKVKAAEALASFMCRSVEVALYCIVRPQCSDSGVNVLNELVQVTLDSLDWPSQSTGRNLKVVCESLALLCSYRECHQYVILAKGQVLFQKALAGGIHSPAIWTALAALLTSDVSCSQGDSLLDEVVRAMALKLPSTKDLGMVKAFLRLCDKLHTGRRVVKPENGAIKVLLDIIKRCQSNPAAAEAAARGLANLASLDDNCRDDVLSSKSSLEESCVDVLLDAGKQCQCIEAMQALNAVAPNSGAAQALAHRIPDLKDLCSKGGRLQELVLEIICHVSRSNDLPPRCISDMLLGNYFPNLLLKLLATPSHPNATTAVRIVHNLCQDSADFRGVMCSSQQEAVTPLLQVLGNPTSLPETRDFAVVALEVFMTPECNGRTRLLDKEDGLDLVLAVLQRTAEYSRFKFYALKILLSLTEPAITPSSARRRVWDRIISSPAPVFPALAQALDFGDKDGLVAAQLLTYCVHQARDPKSLCRSPQMANVLKPLVKFRASSRAYSSTAQELVKLLSSKSSSTRQRLVDLIKDLEAAQAAAEDADQYLRSPRALATTASE